MEVQRPIFFSFSNKKIGLINTHTISRYSFRASCRRAQSRLAIPDVFYGKFLMTGGWGAVELGQIYDRPAFVDLGESSLLSALSYREEIRAKEILGAAAGVICVSRRLALEAESLGVESSKILLKPNEVDTSTFFPVAQPEARAALGLPQEGLIAAFTGYFIDRKGPRRVVAALEELGTKDVKGIFLGRGPEKPTGDKVLFSGAVEHTELNLWLNAADFFVLPTLAEGNCNAINEAQAVGLPVITSDIGDTRVQVPPEVGFRVDPMNVGQLANAILTLSLDSNLRIDMSRNALNLSKCRNGGGRSLQILEWMKSKVVEMAGAS